MTRCKVFIELTIEGSLEHAIDIVESVLDVGDFQNEINNWDPEERPVQVVSALCPAELAHNLVEIKP